MNDSVKRLVSSEPGIAQCLRDMRQMLEEHGYFNFEIKRGNRSLSQNALYWMWMKEIADFINVRKGTDFSTDEIHTKMKHEFLGYEPEKRIGTAVIPVQLKSTKNLTKGEMFSYMSQVDAYAATLSLYLPRPDDCQYEQLKRKNS